MSGLADAPFRHPGPSPAKRAQDLLARMTLDEKLAQLGCVWSTALVEDDAFSERKAARLLAHGTGRITRIGAATGLSPRGRAAFANAIQRHLASRTRLGIPAIVHEESTAGFTARDATQFPQAIGLASTWQPELIERVGRVIREQMRAVGARQTLAPGSTWPATRAGAHRGNLRRGPLPWGIRAAASRPRASRAGPRRRSRPAGPG